MNSGRIIGQRCCSAQHATLCKRAGDSTSGSTLSVGYPPWVGDDANAIWGSSGSQFQSGVSSGDVLAVETYDSGIFRHWDLASTRSYNVQDIPLLEFSLSPQTFANVSVDVAEGTAYNGYGPSGLLNQSNCAGGAPIYLSKPR